MDTTYGIILITGWALVLGIATIGAAASRRFNFNYGILSFLSLAIYLGISIWATRAVDATAGITIAGLITLVDATLGWKLCRKFNANFGSLSEELEEEISSLDELKPGFVIGMVLIGLGVGWIGTLLA